MSINLNTGVIQVPRRPPRVHGDPRTFVGTVTEFNDTTPSEDIIFPTVDRRVLLVEPGTMLVVTGYNLPVKTRISFRKVLRSNGIPAQGTTDCCPSITIAHTIRLHSVELPCWVLDNCNPVFIIKTPGSYEIDVVGEYADVVVTAMAFPLQEVNDFTGCKCEPFEEDTLIGGEDTGGGSANEDNDPIPTNPHPPRPGTVRCELMDENYCDSVYGAGRWHWEFD